MITSLLKNEILASENEYRTFMNLDAFPKYDLREKELSLATVDKQGYAPIAQAHYAPSSDKHTLIISTNIHIPEYVLFHEFTHILDDELFAKYSKDRYTLISGFTEYHASQVELMRLLNADSIDSALSFSKETIISTVIGKRSVSQYINDKLQQSSDLFSKSDFPASIDELSTALGVLFNYLGLQSICQMYSIDYVENCNYTSILNQISAPLFHNLKLSMQGWLTPIQVERACTIYWNILSSINSRYNLF